MESVFYDMICTLRKTEDVVLNNNLFSITESEKSRVEKLLEEEYKSESLNYPFSIPIFNGEVAVKGAELIYVVAQLILYRQQTETESIELLPNLELEVNAETVLSLDLTLRFLPEMIVSLKSIDVEDALIEHLEQILVKWNYSGIKHALVLKEEDVRPMLVNDCLKQLYLNRVVRYKNRRIAKLPTINRLLQASMGMYVEDYWPDFKLITIDE